MPSRFCTLAIVAFWLGTMSWFCYKEVWPRLRPGERPPYTIDLAEEVTGRWAPRQWDLYRNGRKVGYVNAWVEYRRSDGTYEIISKYGFNSAEDEGPDKQMPAANNQKMLFSFLGGLVRVQANGMESTSRVTQDGDLRELEGDVTATVFSPEGEHKIKMRVTGSVEDGYLRPHWKLESPWEFERDTEPVEVATNHSVLNPLQPWSRLHNIRPGQTWRVQLFDPLAESASASIQSVLPVNLPKVEYLDAVVQEIPEDRPWGNPPQTVPCLKIEYRGDNLHALTWVRQSDGLVIRQEAARDEDTPQEERLALERKP